MCYIFFSICELIANFRYVLKVSLWICFKQINIFALNHKIYIKYEKTVFTKWSIGKQKSVTIIIFIKIFTSYWLNKFENRNYIMNIICIYNNFSNNPRQTFLLKIEHIFKILKDWLLNEHADWLIITLN